jgi:hypothetical protein
MEIAPEVVTLPIGNIIQSWENRTLHPNEEYQRGESWSLSQQKLLIDSVLRGYPLPRFYFHSKTKEGLLGGSEATFDIIDGQQRIIAMSEFKAGHWALFDMKDEKVPLPKSIRKLPCSWSARNFSQLDDSTRDRFLKTEVPVVLITGISTPDEVRDLFIRLQSGTALTRQQVRDAWPGHVGPYVVSLAGKLKAGPRFKTFNSVDKRGSYREDTEGLKDTYLEDRQTCAQLLCLLIGRQAGGDISSVNTQALDNMYHTNIEFDPKGHVAKRFEKILGWCDEVLATRPLTSGDRHIKVKKHVLFSIFLLLEDLDASQHAVVDQDFIKRLAKSTWAVTQPSLGEPSGRVSSGTAIATYYTWFLRMKLKDLTVDGFDTKRLFDRQQKDEIWDKFEGKCGICHQAILDKGKEEYDHITPWIRGGPTSVDNGRPVHPSCHQRGRVPALPHR